MNYKYLKLKFMFYCIVFVSVVFLISGLLGIVHVIPNNRKMNGLTAAVSALGLPARTTMVKEKELTGYFAGNGHHCDIMTMILMKTKASDSEVKKYYNSRKITGPCLKDEQKIEVAFYKKGKYVFEKQTPYTEEQKDLFQRFLNPERLCGEDDNCYVIFIRDICPTSLDFRCW